MSKYAVPSSRAVRRLQLEHGVLDVDSGVLTLRDGTVIELNGSERRTLICLANSAPEAVSSEQIVAAVARDPPDPHRWVGYARTMIMRLRSKIEPDTDAYRYVLTVREPAGYRLTWPGAPEIMELPPQDTETAVPGALLPRLAYFRELRTLVLTVTLTGIDSVKASVPVQPFEDLRSLIEDGWLILGVVVYKIADGTSHEYRIHMGRK